MEQALKDKIKDSEARLKANDYADVAEKEKIEAKLKKARQELNRLDPRRGINDNDKKKYASPIPTKSESQD